MWSALKAKAAFEVLHFFFATSEYKIVTRLLAAFLYDTTLFAAYRYTIQRSNLLTLKGEDNNYFEKSFKSLKL